MYNKVDNSCCKTFIPPADSPKNFATWGSELCEAAKRAFSYINEKAHNFLQFWQSRSVKQEPSPSTTQTTEAPRHPKSQPFISKQLLLETRSALYRRHVEKEVTNLMGECRGEREVALLRMLTHQLQNFDPQNLPLLEAALNSFAETLYQKSYSTAPYPEEKPLAVEYLVTKIIALLNTEERDSLRATLSANSSSHQIGGAIVNAMKDSLRHNETSYQETQEKISEQKAREEEIANIMRVHGGHGGHGGHDLLCPEALTTKKLLTELKGSEPLKAIHESLTPLSEVIHKSLHDKQNSGPLFISGDMQTETLKTLLSLMTTQELSTLHSTLAELQRNPDLSMGIEGFVLSMLTGTLMIHTLDHASCRTAGL